MEENKLISVIVPVYNVERYLERCIQSIKSQTYKNLEIILVNDGSGDASGTICEEYAKKDARIQVIHQDNKGLSAARNKGLDLASGSLIIFIDSDDYINVRMIEILYENLTKQNADISICDFRRMSDDEESMETEQNSGHECMSGIEFCHELYRERQVQAVAAWNKLYRIEVFDGARYPEGKSHEDEFLTYQLLYNARKVVYTKAKLYYYIQRPDSIMGEKVNLDHMDAMEGVRNQIIFWNIRGEKKLQIEAVKKYRRVFFIYYLQFRNNGMKPQEVNLLFKQEYDNLRTTLSKVTFLPYLLWIRLFLNGNQIYRYRQKIRHLFRRYR